MRKILVPVIIFIFSILPLPSNSAEKQIQAATLFQGGVKIILAKENLGCYQGECSYHLYFTVNWRKVKRDAVSFKISYSHCKDTQSKEINCKKNECYDKDIFYVICKDVPQFSVVEMMTEGNEQETIHGGKAGDWSKSNKEEITIITKAIHIDYEYAIEQSRYKAISIAKEKYDEYYSKKLKEVKPYKIIRLKHEVSNMNYLEIEWRVK